MCETINIVTAKVKKNEKEWRRYFDLRDEEHRLEQILGGPSYHKGTLQYEAKHNKNEDAAKMVEKLKMMHVVEYNRLNEIDSETSRLLEFLGVDALIDKVAEASNGNPQHDAAVADEIYNNSGLPRSREAFEKIVSQ